VTAVGGRPRPAPDGASVSPMDDDRDRADAGWRELSGPAISMRWWDAGLALTAVVLSVLAASSSSSRVGASLAAVGALVLVWFVAARPVIRRNDGVLSPSALGAAGALVVVGGTAVSATPELATLQAFVMPALWTLMPGPRSAIVANVALCLAISAGFIVGLGWSADAVATAVTSEALSLVFSIALGLWITTIARVGAERGRLLDELRDAQAELAARSRDIGSSTERERLAREIHDTIAQSLTGVVMLAQSTRGTLEGGDVDGALARLGTIEEAAREALTEARTLVAATASSGLTGHDVAAAVQRIAERFRRESGVDVSVRVEAVGLPRDLQVVLIRVVQEALANVRKHSGSATARVDLATDDDTAVLTVADDGRGFDPHSPSTGFGLLGLQERLALAGGSFDVATGPTGTTVTCRMPLSPAGAAARGATRHPDGPPVVAVVTP
jgi:signal transduction histidine kinase